MAHRADDRQQDIDETCQDIEDTRSAITEKLDLLEERVRETVKGAQSSVEEIVGTVKETVEETVNTVKRTLDVPYQVNQHPWLMLGGATLAGYLLGRWSGGSTSPAHFTNDPASAAADTTADTSVSHAKQDCLPPADGELSIHPQLQQDMGSSVLAQVKDEIAMIKVAAAEALISTLREMVKQAVPTMAPHIARARSQRGSQPIERSTQYQGPRSRAGVNGGAI
jgi:ElaB/YqjD/DUF883 family membrane-anchored ribosome-binding protein